MVLIPETEEIYVLDKKVHLLQLAGGGFRTSLDSVMLAAACPAEDGDHVLDMGCGVGGASFCLLWRVKGVRLTGAEWEHDYCELARANIPLNDCVGRADFVEADIRDFAPSDKPLFDHVMCNPPFAEAGAHTPSPDRIKAQALGHQEDDLSLEDWVKAAHRLVKSKGSFTIIYPTQGTDRIIRALGKKFGAVEIIPLWPHASEDSKRVIIRARKDRQSLCRVAAGLVLHEADGCYTEAADKILRDGGAI